MKSAKIAAQLRDVTGSGPVGRLRQEGIVPAVVYSEGKAGRNIQLNEHDFHMMLRGHASEHMIMDIDIENEKTTKVLLKEIQHHPVSGRILHADFQEISMTKKIRNEVAVHLVGDAVGVVQQGGVLEHLSRSVEVECLADAMVESFDVDISDMKIGDHLTAADLKLDAEKYTLISDMDLAIATITAPRTSTATTEEGEEAGAGASSEEPEVVGEKKAEAAAE